MSEEGSFRFCIAEQAQAIKLVVVSLIKVFIEAVLLENMTAVLATEYRQGYRLLIRTLDVLHQYPVFFGLAQFTIHWPGAKRSGHLQKL